MKCKMCGGAGVIQGQAPGLVSCCPACNGKGFIEQTNEEYIHSLNTEQLAELLTKVDEKFPCGTLLKCNQSCGLFEKCISDDIEPTNEEAWVEWLKQPHTVKE